MSVNSPLFLQLENPFVSTNLLIKIENGGERELYSFPKNTRESMCEYEPNFFSSINSLYNTTTLFLRCREDFRPQAETRGKLAKWRGAAKAHKGDRKARVGRGPKL